MTWLIQSNPVLKTQIGPNVYRTLKEYGISSVPDDKNEKLRSLKISTWLLRVMILSGV